MANINTKEYWDKRFSSGNWNKIGTWQTYVYAQSNVSNINIDSNFEGTILDFGCAMGHAIPVYKEAFPKAKIMGIDISESAIEYCKNTWGDVAEFISGDFSKIPNVDIVITSHVMEHLTDDKLIVKEILKKCKDLFIFVPHMETPLHEEHVNYYDENYYHEFNVINKRIFDVKYQVKANFKYLIKNFIRFKFSTLRDITTNVIMYHLQP